MTDPPRTSSGRSADPANTRDFLLYVSPNGKVTVDVYLRDETIWMTQETMAELFGVQRPAVTKHLNNIFAEGELTEEMVSSILEHTTPHGALSGKTQVQKVKYYNLDAIIAVGYRVNSKRATQFRIWATQVLKEYIIKGFAMDDERLKDPRRIFGRDYFEEQLARIRDIRASERRWYQKVTDLYAQCSADYGPQSDITQRFFATVQNKLHYAVSGKTAAEIISERVDSRKPNMGLTSWKNAPNGGIRETDVVIAKNYLNAKELAALNRIVSMYLDYAEMMAESQTAMYMKDWVEKLDAFLKFNEREILQSAGAVSHEVAVVLSRKEFEKFRKTQHRGYVSDFDREMQKLERGRQLDQPSPKVAPKNEKNGLQQPN